jgi:hypothetical protein
VRAYTSLVWLARRGNTSLHARDTGNNLALIFAGMPRKPHTLSHPQVHHHQEIAELHAFWACSARREIPSIPLSSQGLMQADMSTYFAPPGNTVFDTIK